MYFLNTLQERISLSLPLQPSILLLLPFPTILPTLYPLRHSHIYPLLSLILLLPFFFGLLSACFFVLSVSLSLLITPSSLSFLYHFVLLLIHLFFLIFPKSSRLTDKNFFEESVLVYKVDRKKKNLSVV